MQQTRRSTSRELGHLFCTLDTSQQTLARSRTQGADNLVVYVGLGLSVQWQCKYVAIGSKGATESAALAGNSLSCFNSCKGGDEDAHGFVDSILGSS
jgi:hypothetical protein